MPVENKDVTFRTYAEFLHPDDKRIGAVEYSLREVADRREPYTPPGPPVDAIGVRFFDVLVVEAKHPFTGILAECRSDRLNQSNIFFYKEKVTLIGDAGLGLLPSVVRGAVAENMRINGWKAIVYSGGLILPFDSATDKIV